MFSLQFGLYSFLEYEDNYGLNFVGSLAVLRVFRVLIKLLTVRFVQFGPLPLTSGGGRGPPNHLPRTHTPPRAFTALRGENQPFEPASQADALKGFRPRRLTRPAGWSSS